jgi:hypothetical protein
MRRTFVQASLFTAVVLAAAVFASSAAAYGGGASHDTWQVGLSFNCNNPSFCGNDLGGFWGWVEFDRWSDGSITGDAQLTGCAHSVGGGGPGAGAGHADVDATSVRIVAAGPDDPNPGGHVFFVDSNEVTFTGHGAPTTVEDDPDFLGDTGIPVEPGHYSFHPAPGVTFVIQVAFRPAS